MLWLADLLERMRLRLSACSREVNEVFRMTVNVKSKNKMSFNGEVISALCKAGLVTSLLCPSVPTNQISLNFLKPCCEAWRR